MIFQLFVFFLFCVLSAILSTTTTVSAFGTDTVSLFSETAQVVDDIAALAAPGQERNEVLDRLDGDREDGGREEDQQRSPGPREQPEREPERDEQGDVEADVTDRRQVGPGCRDAPLQGPGDVPLVKRDEAVAFVAEVADGLA